VHAAFAVLALAAAAVPASPSAKPAKPVPPAVGVLVNLEPGATPATRQSALEMVRRTGANFFVLELSWAAAEPSPHKYRVEELTRAARVLRQSGAVLHLDLPLVQEDARDVPADLAGVAFDDPRLSLRLGALLDALHPALLDFESLSLGDGADVYFADKPEELRAYRRLFDGAVQFLKKKAPHILVGVTTTAPMDSPAPEVAAALHARSPLLLYSYAPFERGKPFEQREPSVLDREWSALLQGSGGRPIAFPLVSYSSSSENGSSPARQAEFVRRFRDFLARSDGRSLLFARYVALRDEGRDERDGGAPAAGKDVPAAERRRRAFLANRGLQELDGKPKPAWREWVRETRTVKK
jgi:hypothetical protein